MTKIFFQHYSTILFGFGKSLVPLDPLPPVNTLLPVGYISILFEKLGFLFLKNDYMELI